MAEPLPEDALEVAAALRISMGMVVRKLRQNQVGGELSVAETTALSRLDRDGPATSSDLARRDKISPQSMGATIAALEGRGLLARAKDPGDGRRIVLSITEQGRRLVHDRRGARTEQIARALVAAFTQHELNELRTLAPFLERLADKL